MMTIKNKKIKINEDKNTISITLEMNPIFLGRDKKKCFFTQDVVEILKQSGYDISDVIQHSSVSNFREPYIGEWIFELKTQRKQSKIKKAEKQIEPTTETQSSATKDT